MALYQTGSSIAALVGIGTTNPTSNLQVYGTPIAAGNVFSVLNTAASGNVAQFSSSTGTALIINASGQVGIGTVTNFACPFTVYNSASTSTYTGTTAWGNIHLMPNGANNSWAGITFGGSSSGTIQQSTQASITVDSNSSTGTNMRLNVGYLFASGALERMTIIGQTGYVGINSTSPAYQLDVSGKIRSSQLSLVGYTNIVNRRPIWGVGGTASQAYFQTASTTDVSFFLVYQYGPFQYAVPATGTGATRQYRLYVVYVDNMQGSSWNVDFVLNGGTTVSFNMPLTYGGTPWMRDAYSTNTVNDPSNGNHGTINVRFNRSGTGVNPAYVNIHYMELQAIDQY